MKRIFFFLLLIFATCPVSAHAETVVDYGSFARLPIQNEGRIKPVDSFARALLKSMSGSAHSGELSATAWLAESLFDPARALERPVFRTYRPALFGLPPRDDYLYSYIEIAPALASRADSLSKLAARDEKDWSEDERELARIQEISVLYGQVVRSFYDLLPLNIGVPENVAKDWNIDPANPVTLDMLEPHRIDLDARIAATIRKKGHDPARYTNAEKDIAAFAFDLQKLANTAQSNVLFRFYPGARGDEKNWRTPAALKADEDTSARQYSVAWTGMARAYQAGDAAAFKYAADEALSHASSFPGVKTTGLEIFYNNAQPLNIAMALYGLSFLAFVFYGLKQSGGARITSLTFLTLGSAAHVVAIALRVFILSRPPVGTLYESILFVALICACVAILLELIRKDGTGILAGPVAALLLLFCARGFAEDDSLQVLVAVLNTNFWLATHVLCITMGYAWCLIAAIMAHVWFFNTWRGRDPQTLSATIKTLSLIALFFTTFGTILGGIWADQSWGRFWGWDPKENGALLIVLWLIWLVHGQIAGQISRIWFMAGIAALTIVVALAWFGVNLLGAGLHSYGFITGVAAALGTFCAVEAGIIGTLFIAARKRLAHS